jgi:uncharacterized protein
MGHPVNWFQIAGKEKGEALQHFYKQVFDWKYSPSPDGSMMMVAPEKGGIAGGIGNTMDGSEKSVAVYVDTHDIDATLAKVVAAGGHPAMPKMELPGGMGWIAGFIDPAGNFTGLWQGAKKTPAPRAKRAAAKKKAAPKKAAKKGAAKKGAAKKGAAKKTAKKAAKRGAKR